MLYVHVYGYPGTKHGTGYLPNRTYLYPGTRDNPDKYQYNNVYALPDITSVQFFILILIIIHAFTWNSFNILESLLL